MFPPLSDAVARDAAAAFARFDGGGKGTLTRHEFRCAHVAILGHQPSLVELDALLPKTGDGEPPAGVTLPQLCDLVARKLATQEPDDVVRRAFRAFDPQAKGFVSLADLHAAVARVAPNLPQHTVALAFAQLDGDRDGRVAYGDFHAMMRARPHGRSAGVAPQAALAPPREAPPPQEAAQPREAWLGSSTGSVWKAGAVR